MAELKKLQILLPVEMHKHLMAISSNVDPAAGHIRKAIAAYLESHPVQPQASDTLARIYGALRVAEERFHFVEEVKLQDDCVCCHITDGDREGGYTFYPDGSCTREYTISRWDDEHGTTQWEDAEDTCEGPWEDSLFWCLGREVE